MLSSAVDCEKQARDKQLLVAKAQREVAFKNMQTEQRAAFLQKLDVRDVAAERNVAGLIKYAKEITGDLDAFKEQVAFSEKVVEDLKSSGNESVDSLFGMLRKYKRQQANVKEEITKLQKVVLIKENEIITLDQTIACLHDTRANIAANAKKDKEVYTVKATQNEAIIKRKDKLNVDMQ